MKKSMSLQWQLTLLTAVLITLSCLTLSYTISKSATGYMDDIGDSVIAVLPQEVLTDQGEGAPTFELDITADLGAQIQDTQMAFWKKSLLITLCIVIISSSLTYLIVGYALQPLKRLGKQVEEIQAKNMQVPIAVDHSPQEIALLTEAFNNMLGRLSEAFLVQRQFSASAAHELRTPLAVMQTKLEVLQKQIAPSQAEYAEAMDMVQSQTERLSHVIDVLLEMTQLNTTKRGDRISLGALAEEVLCDLAPLSTKKEVTLQETSGDAKILGSDTLVYRALYNLVENAIKYNRPGGTVTVRIERDDALAKVLVSDSGCGIDQEHWEAIFDPFFRVDKSRSTALGGAGLGLALVKEIAQTHGGDVRVLRSSSQGTEIELCLQVSDGL